MLLKRKLCFRGVMVQRWSVCSKVDYRPQTKLQKGNVSTRVCHSVHWGRGMISLPVWSHVPSRREGVVPEGQVWCQRGGGLVPEGCLVWVASHPPTNQKSGRYASYWNAFLFFSENYFDHGYDRITMKNKLINTIDL